MLICPNCDSRKTVKNGRIHNGKQRFKCNECNRQFVENSQKIVINQEKRDLIDRLLLEKISLAGISRAVKVSGKWLQTYVKNKSVHVSRKTNVTPKKSANLPINTTN